MSESKNITHYLYGATAGSISAAITHPFLMIKFALQNNQHIPNNLKSLYKGIGSQMIAMAGEKMIVFGLYNHLTPDKNNIYHSLLFGFLSGTCASINTSIGDQITLIKNKNESITKILNNKKQLINGFKMTALRESIGYSIYFTVFNQLKNKYNTENNIYITGIIGAITSATAWIVIYPIDTIKTNIQSNIYIKHNWKTIYKGSHYALIRTVPYHTSCFMIYEGLCKYY